MKITYDREADALYIRFKEIVKVANTITITANNVNVDVDRQGNLLGIEILNASEVTDVNELVVKDITNN